jgi:GT2 family glycosyltransferase
MDTDEGARPEIAVIIPCVNGLPVVHECLEALAAERAHVPAEVVVVDRCGRAVREHVREHFPWVRLVEAEPAQPLPALMAMGIASCRAEIVAVIEDHCLVCPGWLTRVREAHGGDAPAYAAVGGPVENAAVDRIVDWAAFLCEYSHVMPPVEDGEVSRIPGNNAAYRRSVLDEVGVESYGRLWEYFWHEKIRRQGRRFWCCSNMVVYHKKTCGFVEHLRQRFHYSRSFAAMRSGQCGHVRRLACAAATVALPLIVLRRVASHVIRKRRHVDKLVLCFPLLLPLTISWAIGETVGYLFGPGRSLAKVT